MSTTLEFRTVRLATVIWIATAIALIVVSTVIATQAWSVSAAPGDDDATFVPIAPCRVFDQRDSVPMGPDETVTQQITGTHGDCTIPDDAVAVSMNVTIVLPTAASHLTVFPADLATTPNVSSLNWPASAPPTPNKVDVKLSADGALKFHNFAGEVYVLADIVGYYTSSTLQELAAAQQALAMRVEALEDARPFVIDSGSPTSASNITSDTVLEAIGVRVPADGTVTVFATGQAAESADQAVACSISTNGSVTSAWRLRWKDAGSSNQPAYGQLAGVRAFDVAEGDLASYFFVCENENGGASTVEDAHMVGLFTPDP
ncbi:MAG: hypothetical protein CL424_01160 [Acidimicrobiaceae bacterium]|nr:hypothetical protein [Acidimicrobiaceae bacterium]